MVLTFRVSSADSRIRRQLSRRWMAARAIAPTAATAAHSIRVVTPMKKSPRMMKIRTTGPIPFFSELIFSRILAR